MPNPGITSTFRPEDADRITRCVDALIPHLAAGEFVFVGGLAIRYLVSVAGLKYPDRPFNDLDIAVKNKTTLGPSVCSDFLVAHYHPPDYWALVEPESRVKVDVFGWNVTPGIVQVPYKNASVPIQAVESQLAKTVYDVRRILRGVPVDPKQFMDAELLLDIADSNAAYKYFTAIDPSPAPPTIQAAFREAQRTAEEHPGLLVPKPFRKTKAYTCTECVHEPQYPLAPLGEIQEILGSVE